MKYDLNKTFDSIAIKDSNIADGAFSDNLRGAISEILGIGRASGAGFVDIFLERREYFSMGSLSGAISSVSPSLSIGVGIRVYHNDQTGYACTNSLTFASLVRTLENALSIVGLELPPASSIITPIELEPLRDYVKSANKLEYYNRLPTSDEIKDKMLRIDESLASKVSHVESVTGRYFHDIQEVLVASTEGVFARDLRLNSRLGCQVLAQQDDHRTSIHRAFGYTAYSDFLTDINETELAEDIAKSAGNMLTAKFVEAGEYPVVLGNAFGGVIFHEACGHLLETTQVAKKSSPFTDSKGELIANEAVTAWDEGHTAKGYGSIHMDDEGMPSQKTLLIENGVLKNFLADRIGSVKTGHPRTGSGRKENYTFAPASRMRNTWLAPGKNTREELIASVDEGIYCEHLGGGSVNPTGDFNFAASEAWKIKNGALVEPLKGATLVGSAKDILKQISMCANDLSISAGHCGSISGTVYTTVGQPHIKVDKITIGGR